MHNLMPCIIESLGFHLLPCFKPNKLFESYVLNKKFSLGSEAQREGKHMLLVTASSSG